MEYCDNCGSCLSIKKTYPCRIPHHIAATNEPPLDSERPALESLLSDADDELDTVENEIWELSTKLARLERRRESVQQTIDACRGTLSPVRSVPREIWTEIFNHTTTSKHASFRADRGIWRLGRVCRIWKDAAIASSYWATIVVPTVDQPNARHHRFRRASREILETMLRYNAASSRPVSLALTLCKEDSLAEGLVDIAVRYSELWQDVTLHLTSRLQTRLQPVLNRLPKLQSLSLKLEQPSPDLNFGWQWLKQKRDSHPDPTAWCLGAAFENAPLLSSLAIQVTTPVDLSALNFPWSQVKRFILSKSGDYRAQVSASSLALSHIYSKMPNLTSFRGWDAVSAPDDQSPVKLGKLQTLDMRLATEFPDILDRVHLPGLRTISNIQCSFLHRVVTLIQRWGCNVTSVNIFSLHNLPQDLSRFFDCVPDLTVLEFGFMMGREIDILLQVLNHSTIPRLEQLTLPIGLKGIDKLVRKLVGRTPPLKRLFFNDSFPDSEEVKKAQKRRQELMNEFAAKLEIGPLPLPWSVRRRILYESDDSNDSNYYDIT